MSLSPGNVSPSFATNPVIERTQSQWLFTPEELLLSPSILEGMPAAQELANRQKGVNFITQVGIMLKLPQLTLATASVYLHRFFMRHAMAQNSKPGLHHYSVAATALFLATKVEENYRKMRELVVACCRVAQKQPNLVVDEQSKEYWKWRDTILHNEDLLLEALCFDLQLEQPYRILLDFLRVYGVQENKQLRNTSWAFLNDSLVTTMCLQLSPSAIASSALYMGLKFAEITLPDDETGRPWWEQLSVDMSEIQRGCNLMAEVYENPTLPRQGQKDAYVKDEDLSIFDRTRHAATPQHDRSPAGSARSGSQGVKRDRDALDDPNSGEWGSTIARRPSTDNQSQPSPKRPRRDSRDGNTTRSDRPSQRVPPNVEDRTRGESAQVVDDVQKRIDEIVHNSSGAGGPAPHLPRRPSNQTTNPQSSMRRHSSSASNRSGPAPSYSNGHQDRLPPQGRPDSRDNGVYNQSDQFELPKPSSRVPPAQSEATASQLTRPEPKQNGVDAIDDAQKVDYGSEEGEV
ncbi:hypothetical protein LTR10_018108 [Elasticomyces elasticus]|uniref:RNA polymerase II holoenzyme cyclin-like subunit n=1 Tax=Exophiala sideris TaxID=1016849 RepID=A0ABR0IWL2_9EURO|nr:hypothetical protein LTR10_018108 [Elasticomyces elasticus]KAK5021705.1 hypothetical protein LTS07_010747 [Exophiala sideris]KAK5025140.1 hypothetical protein LTR13_010577 [Exophiala sideris]KAK5050136.1 hypothetical protein LTR69_010770 [Exophiala sideris]KAK5176884.1 hypothetical protein LTR44_010580 [Eurotiomycetes sp. CCFEE 6388]